MEYLGVHVRGLRTPPSSCYLALLPTPLCPAGTLTWPHAQPSVLGSTAGVHQQLLLPESQRLNSAGECLGPLLLLLILHLILMLSWHVLGVIQPPLAVHQVLLVPLTLIQLDQLRQ
jgi:hypothetical protein